MKEKLGIEDEVEIDRCDIKISKELSEVRKS